MTIRGKLEKNKAYSSLSDDKNRVKSIEPRTIENTVKMIAIIPFTSKLKVKPFSVAVIPARMELPSTRDGIVTAINMTNKIFVLVFIVLFFAKIKIVYIDFVIKKIFAQII